MIIIDHPLDWYINKLENNEHFCLGRYGDAEWLCAFEEHIGGNNSSRTIFTKELCRALKESLEFESENYFFSTCDFRRRLGLVHHNTSMEKRIDSVTKKKFLLCDLWDTLSRTGGLIPFIKQIQGMKTCIVSRKELRGLTFLKYDEYIEVDFPNCFGNREKIISRVKELGNGYVYLLSAGLPAAIFSQDMHRLFDGKVFSLDLGSLWDAFIGPPVGAQRPWRRNLYADPRKYKSWKGVYEEVLQ